jgi:hypothetical protein
MRIKSEGRRVSERKEGVSRHIDSRDMQFKRGRRGGRSTSPMLVGQIIHKRYGRRKQIEK